MEALIVALAPMGVALVMALVKKLPVFPAEGGLRTLGLRVGVAGVSFLAYVLEMWAAGVPVDPTSAEAFVMTVLNFLGATGTYFLFKRK